ncbi:transcription initiation factor TFIID subunit 6-like isoform X2 [Euphorbia lathyris]|uniref:transcription initiation factor TFIID subunit 6-like isoform X2 n=1 Tax=Euphorbia lathyris TaxID=212925 RepID=UPI00331427D5
MLSHLKSTQFKLYFHKIAELTLKKSDSKLFKQALVSLASDSGLHRLLPYFTYLIADEVSQNLNNFPILFALMRVTRSLLQNPHIHVEPYLHQLIPSIITYLVAKRLANRFSEIIGSLETSQQTWLLQYAKANLNP